MLRVGIFTSNAISRAGLSVLLQSTEVDIVAEVNELNAIQTLLELPTVDVVVLELPELNTLTVEQLRDALETRVDCRPILELPGCVVITTATEMPDSASITTVLAVGVRGLLPHTTTPEEIEIAIAAAANGLTILHPTFSDRLLEEAPVPEFHQEIAEPLSDRELQVLDALSLGLSNKQIGCQLYISEHTVKFHISSILSKLQVSGRTEAVAVGIRLGLIKL